MFHHLMMGVKYIERSKQFDDQVLALIVNASPGIIRDLGFCQRVYYRYHNSVFILETPLNKKPAIISNGFTLGFKAKSANKWMTFGLSPSNTEEFPLKIRQVFVRCLTELVACIWHMFVILMVVKYAPVIIHPISIHERMDQVSTQ